MKKIIAVAVLAFASSAVFAAEVSSANRSNDSQPVVDTSLSTTDAPVTASTASALEKSALKVGSVLGGMFRTSYKLGQAVGNGVREGLSDGAKSTDVKATSAQPAIPPSNAALRAALVSPAALPAAAFVAMVSNPVTHRLAAMVKRDKDHPDAPIEERSMLASNPD